MQEFTIPGPELRQRQLPVIVSITSHEVGILRIVAMQRTQELMKARHACQTDLIALNNALDTLGGMAGGVARFSGRQAGELMRALALNHNFIGGPVMAEYVNLYQKIKAAR